jgi:F-type H+-transporting ATPase subunit b
MITSAWAAGAPAGGQKGGVFPPFDASTFGSQLFWLAVLFGLMYFVLASVALPRVARILEDRRSRIEGDLAEAARLQQKAEEAGVAYEEALARARGNAQAIAGKARDEAAQAADARRKALEADLNARLATADATIGQTKAAALANVGSIASEAASDIVARLVGQTPTAAELKAAIAAPGK